MSNVGKQFPSEMETYTDLKSGRKIRQLTRTGANTHFYFTENSFIEGDNEIFFRRKTADNINSPVNDLFSMDLRTGVITQRTDLGKHFKKAGVSGNKTKDGKYIIFSGDGDIWRINLETNDINLVFKIPEGYVGSGSTLSYDGNYYAMALGEEPEIGRKLSNQNYDGFVERFYAKKCSKIFVMEADGSNAHEVFRDTHWVGHFQFAPDSNEYLMFCHEGPWNLVQQRIWMYNLISRDIYPIYRQGKDDCVGHEFWTRDGLIFYDNRGAGHDGTITSDKTQATVFGEDAEDAIPLVGFADRKGNILREMELPYYCNHYHANNDNTLLVADAVNDLILIDISKDKASIDVLCEHNTSWISHSAHCHPTWSWSNDKILFASDKGNEPGRSNLYLIDM